MYFTQIQIATDYSSPDEMSSWPRFSWPTKNSILTPQNFVVPRNISFSWHVTLVGARKYFFVSHESKIVPNQNRDVTISCPHETFSKQVSLGHETLPVVETKDVGREKITKDMGVRNFFLGWWEGSKKLIRMGWGSKLFRGWGSKKIQRKLVGSKKSIFSIE